MNGRSTVLLAKKSYSILKYTLYFVSFYIIFAQTSPIDVMIRCRPQTTHTWAKANHYSPLIVVLTASIIALISLSFVPFSNCGSYVKNKDLFSHGTADTIIGVSRLPRVLGLIYIDLLSRYLDFQLQLWKEGTPNKYATMIDMISGVNNRISSNQFNRCSRLRLHPWTLVCALFMWAICPVSRRYMLKTPQFGIKSPKWGNFDSNN